MMLTINTDDDRQVAEGFAYLAELVVRFPGLRGNRKKSIVSQYTHLMPHLFTIDLLFSRLKRLRPEQAAQLRKAFQK